MEILYTSSDVHKAIKKIFVQSKSAPVRRVAVVAYLGVNAESFLPSPINLEIICNPEQKYTGLKMGASLHLQTFPIELLGVATKRKPAS